MANRTDRIACSRQVPSALTRCLSIAAVGAVCLLGVALTGCSSTPDNGRSTGNFSLLRDPPDESPQTVEEWLAQPRPNP